MAVFFIAHESFKRNPKLAHILVLVQNALLRRAWGGGGGGGVMFTSYNNKQSIFNQLKHIMIAANRPASSRPSLS